MYMIIWEVGIYSIYLKYLIPTKIIQEIWTYKIKINPDGTLNKHKEILFVHRGQQKWGENFWDTYSSVVNWLTIRRMLII